MGESNLRVEKYKVLEEEVNYALRVLGARLIKPPFKSVTIEITLPEITLSEITNSNSSYPIPYYNVHLLMVPKDGT